MTPELHKNIVFIDSAVSDLDAILESLPADAEVVRLEAGSDGLSQIASALAGRSGIESLHIVSHGGPGLLKLGSANIDLTSFGAHAADFNTIRASLSAGADLLLYGCDVAAGVNGFTFIKTLAAVTGADVAASTNLTGATQAGGDWTLEASTGNIEAATIAATEMAGTLAAPTITMGDTSILFEEGKPAVVIGENIQFTSGSSYGGGYVRFEVADSASGDQLGLNLGNAATPNAIGAISVDGNVVYLGNGTGKDVVGSVDEINNGKAGNPLQVNFSSNFANPSFESGNGSVTGWDIGTEWVNLGTTKIGGWTTPEDLTNAPNSGGDNEEPDSAQFNYEIAKQGSDGGSSLRLFSNISTLEPYDTVHGPYALSNEFKAAQGDVLYFDWKAAGGSDAFDAFGYLLNADTGDYEIVLNRTGVNAAESTNWETKSVTVPTSGNYHFVFVSGTWDATGGQAAGGSLFIDNFKVFGNKVNDTVVTNIAALVTYENTGDPVLGERDLTVTVADGSNNTSTGKTTLVIKNENDAPTFAPGDVNMPAVLEDTEDPAGATVLDIFTDAVIDPDNDPNDGDNQADVLGGVVVVGNASKPEQGKWEYSVDGGDNWKEIGEVSSDHGLVLDAATKLRFVPAADYATTGAEPTPGALTVHAIDSSYDDDYSDATGDIYLDTTTGFDPIGPISQGTAKLVTKVTEVNDAPVLLNPETAAPVLTGITENDVNNAGNLVSDLVLASRDGTVPDGETKSVFSDIDFGTNGANAGVAIYNLSNDGLGGGHWEYSINGGTSWTDVGTVSETQALLLSSNDKIRFVPDEKNGTEASFDYYLWDGEKHNHGTKANVATRGGESAFSQGGASATIDVESVDDAPVVDLGGNASGTGHSTDYLVRGPAVKVAADGMTITDVDLPAEANVLTKATIEITKGAVDNSFGTIYETVSSSFGGTMGPLTITGNGTALLTITGAGTLADYEAAIKSVTYKNANPSAFQGEREVTVKVFEGAGVEVSSSVTKIDNVWAPAVDTNGTAEGTIYEASYTEGTAPVRIASGDSTITNENSHLKLVEVKVSNATDTGHEKLTMQASTKSLLEALPGVTVTGDGTSHITLTGNLTPSQAQLALRSITYENTSRNPTEATRIITIEAIDSQDQKGVTGETHIDVIGVPNAPEKGSTPLVDLPGDNPGDPGYGSGEKTFVIPSDAFVDADGDVLEYDATQSDGSPLPTWLKFDPETGTFKGNPPASADGTTLEITVTATDPSGRKVEQDFKWSFNDTNDLPTLGKPIADQELTGSGEFGFTLPTGTFTDADGDALDLTAKLADGNDLPDWLTFDPETRTFGGNPPHGATSPLTIRVSADDGNGGTITDDFVIELKGELNDAPTAGTPIGTQVFRPNAPISYKLPDTALVDADGDTLTYDVKLADGRDLPSWLIFDPVTRTFTGTSNGTVTLPIRIVATDSQGESVTVDFNLVTRTPPGGGGTTPPVTPPVTPPTTPVDDDNDGIGSSIEDLAPALTAGGVLGDGNGDGIADHKQASVTSAPLVRTDIKNPDGSPVSSYVSLVADSVEGKVAAGSVSKLATFTQVASPADLPSDMSHPMGMIAFKADVGTAGKTENFSLYVDKSLSINGYWKLDKFGDWVNLASEEYGGKLVVEGEKVRLDFKITDGGDFDADGKADGIITDPGAAGFGYTTKSPDDLDNDQFPDHLEAANGLTVGVKDNDVFTDSKLFVMQMYRDTLFREAEDGGLAYWKGLMDNGTLNRAQVAEQFLNSVEFEDMAGALARMYMGAFDRLPDNAGMTFWMKDMHEGMTAAEVAQNFAGSAEFKDIYGALGNAELVGQLYLNILERQATQEEIGTWTGKLAAGASHGELLLGVSNSAENIVRADDEVSMALAYAGMLGRAPDQEGFDYWMGRVDAGSTHVEILAEFIAVPEYHDRFLP